MLLLEQMCSVCRHGGISASLLLLPSLLGVVDGVAFVACDDGGVCER